jgi:hypothetical protein
MREDGPTPIRRRNNAGQRPKRVRLAAVLAAETSGVVLAAKATGIPESTIRGWLDSPEFAEIRAKTKDDLADEVKVAGFLAWRRVIETMPTMHPRDAIFAAEKAVTILQLLTGAATSRLEMRDVTDTLDDHEKAQLQAVLREVIERVEA